jgi:hypothetical protein
MPGNRLKSDEMLRYLSEEDKARFLSELLHAIDQSISDGNFDAISLCIENWEDTVELLSIPGLKDRVWAQFTKLKEAGRVS